MVCYWIVEVNYKHVHSVLLELVLAGRQSCTSHAENRAFPDPGRSIRVYLIICNVYWSLSKDSRIPANPHQLFEASYQHLHILDITTMQN